jgi:hypothetical protein
MVDEMADGRIGVFQKALRFIGIIVRRDADDREVAYTVRTNWPTR